MEEALAPRRHVQAEAAEAAGAVAEHGDVARVAAELRDVVPDPDQHLPLVPERQVAGHHVVLQTHEAQGPDPVVAGDDDDLPGVEERPRQVVLLRGVAHDEAAAVHPEHDGQLGLGRVGVAVFLQLGLGLVHVDVEAVLLALQQPRHVVVLDGFRARLGGVQHSVPRLGRLRQREPEAARGRLGVGDPGEGGEPGAARGLGPPVAPQHDARRHGHLGPPVRRVERLDTLHREAEAGAGQRSAAAACDLTSQTSQSSASNGT